MSNIVNKGIKIERTYTKYVSYFWYFIIIIAISVGVYRYIYPTGDIKKTKKESLILIAFNIILAFLVYLNNYFTQKSKVYAGVKGVSDVARLF